MDVTITGLRLDCDINIRLGWGEDAPTLVSSTCTTTNTGVGLKVWHNNLPVCGLSAPRQ